MDASPATSWRSSSNVRFACAFVAAPHCAHKELFHSDYQRANRLHQTKIMRCFPHCCPGHVDRSYCGSSLWLRVQSSSTALFPRSPPEQQLRVFARFRPVGSSAVSTLIVDDVISLDRVRGSLQSESTPCAEWITSELVAEDKDPRTNTRTWLFEINPSRRWYYAWRSGKLNAQRFTTHVLEAVVFSGTERHDDWIRVVATTQSSAFTIVSFRRRHGSGDQDGKHGPLTALEAGLLERILQQSTPQESAHEDEAMEELRQPQESQEPETGDQNILVSDSSFTEQLGMLFASVQDAVVLDVSACVPAWNRYEPDAQSLSWVLGPTNQNRITIANVVWWLCMDPSIHHSFQHYAAWASDHLLDSRALEHVFEQWNQRLRALIDVFLERYSLSWPVIMASTDRQRRRHIAHGFDWEAFVAQARQCAVHRSIPQRENHPSSRLFGHALNGGWQCPLSAISIRTTTSGCPRLRVADLPLTTVFSFWQQLAWIQLRITTAAHNPSIAIGSAVPKRKRPHRTQDGTTLEMDDTLMTRLVLDGRSRSFNTLPHGESTLSGSSSLLSGQCFGDYVGVVDHVAQQLLVTFFSWPSELWWRRSRLDGDGHGQVQSSSFAYRWMWTLPLEPPDEQLLQVDVAVACAVIGEDVADPACGGLACMTIHERLAQVDRSDDSYAIHCTYQRI